MIVSTRSQLIEKIRKNILHASNWTELEEVLVQLEVAPFCALQTCYDLQHVVFHILNGNQRAEVLRHIASFPALPRRVHIMTTLEFIQNMSPRQKLLFGLEETGFITIFSPDTEQNEYMNRNRAKPLINSMISNLPEEGSAAGPMNNLKMVLSNQTATRVATKYVNTIVNYLRLFPHYEAVWVDTLNPISIIISNKMHEQKQQDPGFRWGGAILMGTPSRKLKSDLRPLNLKYFSTQTKLLEHLADSVA
jgi:hypothetical protein